MNKKLTTAQRTMLGAALAELHMENTEIERRAIEDRLGLGDFLTEDEGRRLAWLKAVIEALSSLIAQDEDAADSDDGMSSPPASGPSP